MPKARALDLNAQCTVGRAVKKAARQKLADYNTQLEANYKWLEELLQVVKQTFASSNAELLPKTPSSKRAQAVLRRRRSRQPQTIAEENEDGADYAPSNKKPRKMLGVRSSRRLQQGRRSSTRGTRTSTRRHPARSNATVSITCEAEVHSTHDDPSLQLRFKPKAVTMVIDDSDDETANEVNTTPVADNDNRCGTATRNDSGHFSGPSASIPKATPMDVDGVATPDSGVTCPKLSQRASVSLGERCSGDLVQNLSSTNVASPSTRDSGLPTVKDAVSVTEGTPGPVHAIAVDTPPTTPSMSSRTPEPPRSRTHRSSRRSSHSNARVSLSKSRRSSAYRNKLSRFLGVAGRKVLEEATQAMKSQPIIAARNAATSVLARITTPERIHCTRSKMRTKDAPPPAVLSPRSQPSQSEFQTPPLKPVRTCRTNATTVASSSEDTEEPKGSNSAATSSGSGSDTPVRPPRPARPVAQKIHQSAEASESIQAEPTKRPVSTERHHGRSFSAPKRQCTYARNETASAEDRVHADSVIADTPSPIMTAKKAVSQLRNHNRLRTTPGHSTNTVSSFIRRFTPQKQQLDIVELKRQELATKDQQNSTRLQKRHELMQKRAEDQRKRREERQLLAAKRREEREREMREMRLDMIQRSVDKSVKPNQSYAMRLREERRELREKKMADVEQRRKVEEEARQQKFATLEEDQRRHEELKRRQHDYEEQERVRRIAETERQRQQRQHEVEQERRRLAERQRQQEADRVREEQGRQRIREEREKERTEREKQEVERQREREERKQEELKRLREQERQRIEKRREAERKEQEEEKRLRQMMDKHNTSLQQAKTTAPPPSASQGKKHALNTSYTVSAADQSAAPESYEITPPVKKKPASAENYNIDDIDSGDSTDDEGAPRKKIPSWAVGVQLKAGLINQYHDPPDLDTIFALILPPDLNILFANKRKPRFNKRTSSAVWHSPIYSAAGR